MHCNSLIDLPSHTMTSPSVKRYVLVGTGARAFLFGNAILSDFRETAALVALCDNNPARMNYHNRVYGERFGADSIPSYHAADFDGMVGEVAPDVAIVTTPDWLHARYIIRAMELGLDVVCEKPMATDADGCRDILEAARRTGRRLRVTFNCRYSPARSKLKELLMAGLIGEILSVHFEWLLDTSHGADYFRRWHRDKRNSGGLLVHKATHHFDLINWWIESYPQTVFAFGRLGFYGRANGERNGHFRPYYRATGAAATGNDPFALDLRSQPLLEGLYLDAESEDGYLRDLNVFGDGISIEDTLNVLVRYRSGTQVSYSLTAHSPYEGYRVSMNGTAGRVELEDLQKSHIRAGETRVGDEYTDSQRLTVFPHWGKPHHIGIPPTTGGHGGGDPALLQDIFNPDPPEDPLGRAAGVLDGARSIMTGIAANESMASGRPSHLDPTGTYLLCNGS